MVHSTSFPLILTEEKTINSFILLNFGLSAFNAKNLCGRAKSFDKTFLRCGHKSLCFVIQKCQQLTDAAVVEFGVQVVEQKERIFAARGVIDGYTCELEDKQRTSLLAGVATTPVPTWSKSNSRISWIRRYSGGPCLKV